MHAADGYARATGEVGVALVTSGPGVTNAVTGIATAYMDSIPMVIVTGQVPTPAIGLDAFQECDTVGITRPVVKHNFLVKDVRDLAVTMKKAFHIARTGRPGPVVVDIPEGRVDGDRAVPATRRAVEMRSYNPVRRGHGGQIRKAAQLPARGQAPYIYTGGGVVIGNASAELRALVDLLGFPAPTRSMGLGAYPASDPKFLGMLGMHGTYEANMTMQNCDVLLAVGARFDDRVIGNPKHFASVERKIIHIDIDPSSISKRVKVDIPIVGDVKEVLLELAAQIRESPSKPDVKALSPWWAQINEWRKRDCLAYPEGRRRDQAAARDRDALGADQGPGDLHHLRRRPAPDVGGAVLPLRGAAPLDQLRRPRHHGRGPAVRDGHQARPARGRGGVHHRRRLDPDVHPGALDLPAVHARRSRSSRSTTATSAWCGSGSRSTTARRYSHSYMDALPDFVKLAEAYGHVGIRIDKPERGGAGAARGAAPEGPHRVPRRPAPTRPRTSGRWCKAGKGITEMLLGSEDL